MYNAICKLLQPISQKINLSTVIYPEIRDSSFFVDGIRDRLACTVWMGM